MKRPKQHDINTLAQRLFEQALPANLVVRWQPADDYGIDGEIEYFDGEKTTGAIFKVQLKGTKQPRYSAAGDSISFSFDLDNATYLIEQVEIPTVIILCDVDNQSVYWLHVHGNQELRDAYQTAKTRHQKSFTIRFRTQNILPDTFNQMLHALRQGNNEIALKRSAIIQAVEYARYAENMTDIDAEILHLTEKIEVIRSEKLHRLIDTSATLEAESLVNQILESTEASAIAKFDALVATEQILAQLEDKSIDRLGGFEKAQFDLWQAQEMANLSAQLPAHLQQLSQGYSIAAEMSYLALTDFNLFINWKLQKSAHERDGEALEPFWFAVAPLVRDQYTTLILDKINASSGLINLMMREGHWEVLVQFIVRILYYVSLFVLRLKAEGLQDIAQHIEQWNHQVIEVAAGIAEQLTDENYADYVRFVCAMALVHTAKGEEGITNQALVERAFEIQKSIRNTDKRRESEVKLREIVSRNYTGTGVEEKLDWENIERFYRQQATALGIDLDLADPDSGRLADDASTEARIAWIINLGIKDLNPTRVLKNCKHLVFEYWGGIGVPAQMIGLYSARMKLFSCLLHRGGRTVATYSLDEAYARFYEMNCSTCSDNEPHAPDWEYNEEWHKQKLEELRIAREAYKKRQEGN